MLKKPKTQTRQFSEFKQFFGFEERLEKTKFKNDRNLEFDTNKMNNIAIFVTSVLLGTTVFTIISKKRR